VSFLRPVIWLNGIKLSVLRQPVPLFFTARPKTIGIENVWLRPQTRVSLNAVEWYIDFGPGGNKIFAQPVVLQRFLV
jgi:hypothetical protein